MVENALSLQSALEQLAGSDFRIELKRGISGGDINKASLITLNSGRQLFLKENRVELVSMFSSEAAGLRALGSAGNGAAPVPEALAWGTEGRASFLLMEAVEIGQLFSGEDFGKSLAVMHKQARSTCCGFSAENRIGSSIQHNTSMESWHDFFAEKRLGVQWKMAREKGYGDAVSDKAVESLLKGLKNILPEPDEGRPSLLHGDLWGGNWLPGADGRGWLIDPAVYYGHREADIAMTELFGGFPSGFYSGYRNFWPLEPGYSERRDLYNLYHLLNHLNLFGSSWWSGVIGTIRKYS